jgi:DNA-directed RNA polymerase specialized sigma24 family protein
MSNPSRQADEIERKLSVLMNLLAYQIAEGKTLAEAAPILRRLGLTPSEIAVVFNSSPNAVGVRLAEAKRKQAKPKE